MKTKKLRIVSAVLVLSGMAWSLVLPVNLVHRVQAEVIDKTVKGQTPIVPSIEQVSEQVDKSSVEFEENRGQFDRQVRYRARAAGSTVFLTATEAVYVLPLANADEETSRQADEETRHFDDTTSPRLPVSSSPRRAFALRMQFVGANADSLTAGEAMSEHRTNYFKGADEANWQTDVPNFGRVRYENVYEGIGMVWHGREGGAMQYDFVVSPEANPDQINLRFDGAERLETDAEGNLLIYTEAGVIKQTKPFTYQESEGFRSEIESGFAIDGTSVRFVVGEYDRSKTLTIDPTVNLSNLAFSTFLGGAVTDRGNAIAVDRSGNIYVTGETDSDLFPTTAGGFDTNDNGGLDVFVTKLNPTGNALVYSTFIGGRDDDTGLGIALDASGNAYITGDTVDAPIDYPTTAGAFDTTHNGGADVFVTKLNPTGSALIYSTFIGGSGNDRGLGIALDASGNAYITGDTVDAPTDYPTTAGDFDTTHNGSADVFVTKLNPTGSALIYSTFIGGSGIDIGLDIARDASGNTYITGITYNDVTDYPTMAGDFDTTHNGGADVFVTKLNPTGSALVYSTFIGGSLDDVGNGIAVDASGNAYITGYTEDAVTDYPTVAGDFDTFHNGNLDVFVTKLNSGGAALVYSTFIGAGFDDVGKAIALDVSGNAYITGSTTNTLVEPYYPTTAGAFDTTHNAGSDVFVTRLNSNGNTLGYSTFIGGSGNEGGNGIALDVSGNAYITGYTTDFGTDYPTTVGAFQPFSPGGTDGFVSKFGDFAITGKVIDPTTGNPVSNVMVAMSGQVSANMLTGADGLFIFADTVQGQPHTVSASRSGYSINPALFNIANLNGNRELIFLAQVGSPTGGSGGTLLFENLSYQKGENGASVTVTVNRTGLVLTTEPVTVDFQTVNETALAGSDYALTNGILTFNFGENSKTITIPLLNDTVLEPRESFRVELSNSTNDAEIDTNRGTTTLQILDEDLTDGNLLISEFRQRGRLGANDEYVKLFNPNDFDVTAFAADGSNGLTLAKANGANVSSVAMIPNLVTIPARGHYLLTNNNPNGGFSLIDYPTGIGTNTSVGDAAFSNDIADHSNLVLLKTSNPANFNQSNRLDAVGFSSGWTSEGSRLPSIAVENAETSFVRKLNSDGTLQDTNSNRQDFLLVDNRMSGYTGSKVKTFGALGTPAPETTESLRLFSSSAISFGEYAERYDQMPVPNGNLGTLTLYRQITNTTNAPITRLRLRVIDFPTAGSQAQRRFSTLPDFRILSSMDETIDAITANGTTLAAERLQPAGGGINSTLSVDAITPNTPLLPNQSVVVAIRLGVMRDGEHPFTVVVEAMQ